MKERELKYERKSKMMVSGINDVNILHEILRMLGSEIYPEFA